MDGTVQDTIWRDGLDVVVKTSSCLKVSAGDCVERSADTSADGRGKGENLQHTPMVTLRLASLPAGFEPKGSVLTRTLDWGA